MKFKNFSQFINTYRNELQDHDFNEKTMHLLLDEVKTGSNLLKSIQVVQDQYFEVSELVDIGGAYQVQNIPINRNNDKSRIIIRGAEHDYKEIGGKSVFAMKLEDEVKDILETRILEDFNTKGHVVAAGENATIFDKIVGIKEQFGDREFTLAVGLKDYIEITKNTTVFPIKVLYVPKIQNDVFGFTKQGYYLNTVFGSVDFHKDIMTGVCTMGMSVLVLDSFVRDGSVYKING